MLGWFFVLLFQSLHIQKTWKLVPSTLNHSLKTIQLCTREPSLNYAWAEYYLQQRQSLSQSPRGFWSARERDCRKRCLDNTMHEQTIICSHTVICRFSASNWGRKTCSNTTFFFTLIYSTKSGKSSYLSLVRNKIDKINIRSTTFRRFISTVYEAVNN